VFPSGDDEFGDARDSMLADQLRARGIHDTRVLNALRTVPRHEFVPANLRKDAYADAPLPIGHDQTISQPYMVACMTQLLALKPDDIVLEIGTGSGYQTAVLSLLAKQVYSLERYRDLANQAAIRLSRLGYTNVDVHVGDGSQGLADMAPFDAILVTAAAPRIPGPLQTQLNANGGRLVIPVGNQRQSLQMVVRNGDHWQTKRIMSVKFVPLIGRYGFKDSK
jgi:protein-L-isoaspartate(D-aspartate) O-methyltransferase